MNVNPAKNPSSNPKPSFFFSAPAPRKSAPAASGCALAVAATCTAPTAPLLCPVAWGVATHNCTVFPNPARACLVPSQAAPLRRPRIHQSNTHLVLAHGGVRCAVGGAAQTKRQYFVSVGRLVYQRSATTALCESLRKPSVRFLHMPPRRPHWARALRHFLFFVSGLSNSLIVFNFLEIST